MKLKVVKASVCFNEEFVEWLHFMLVVLDILTLNKTFMNRNFRILAELTESCEQVSDIIFFQVMLLFSSKIIFMKVPQKAEI